VYAAETGFLLAMNPDTVLAPDAAFIRQERVAAFPSSYWCGRTGRSASLWACAWGGKVVPRNTSLR
jgi:hypothetical protein